MGKLIYANSEAIEIEDRSLAHLRLVIGTKLRRGEGFMFRVPSPHGTFHRILWVHPSHPLQFRSSGSRVPPINPLWAKALMSSANSHDGLRLIPEPRVVDVHEA